jgi:hypothetical protein
MYWHERLFDAVTTYLIVPDLHLDITSSAALGRFFRPAAVLIW